MKDAARKERLDRKDSDSGTDNDGNAKVYSGINENKKLNEKTSDERAGGGEEKGASLDPILALGTIVSGSLCVLDEKMYRAATAAALVQQPME